MVYSRVLLPCPHCGSAISYEEESLARLELDSCLLCGQDFPDHYAEAAHAFLDEAAVETADLGIMRGAPDELNDPKNQEVP